ncbi:hypothetical protein Cni_G26571 [Canna indica]|uniref:CCHC-type domain-containing protein n=1 Tax=Canna indica TaxID=4628 RepID=A0AAQ3KZ95_9LILI|nr:hypothetical protein Cni_G26571 [Canna indica]
MPKEPSDPSDPKVRFQSKEKGGLPGVMPSVGEAGSRMLCFKCGRVGHKEENCKLTEKIQEQTKDKMEEDVSLKKDEDLLGPWVQIQRKRRPGFKGNKKEEAKLHNSFMILDNPTFEEGNQKEKNDLGVNKKALDIAIIPEKENFPIWGKVSKEKKTMNKTSKEVGMDNIREEDLGDINLKDLSWGSITSEESSQLEKSISIEEIWKALTNMGRGKSPGKDGSIVEFFLHN